MDPKAAVNATPSPIYKRTMGKKYAKIYNAIKRGNVSYLKKYLKKNGASAPVNLSEDPLLNVLIAFEKREIVSELLKIILLEDLGSASNHDGDTAIHVAVKMGDTEVAEKLLDKCKDLIKSRNKQLETPFHKAALYGDIKMFRLLERYGDCESRRKDGSTVLHCAIMSNAPALALEIAKNHPRLMNTRNDAASIPLQLMVTIPDAFRSKAELGFFEDLFYDYCISVNEDIDVHETQKCDVEQQATADEKYWPTQPDDFLTRWQNKFSPACFFNMLTIILVPANWIRLLLFRILKQSFLGVELLEQKKINHTQTMMLVEYLAKDPECWDFIVKGWKGLEESASFTLNTVQSKSNSPTKKEEYPDAEDEKKKAGGDSGIKRWNDSPLTLGAMLGLHDFVVRILKVCPQSALFLDAEGKNVLQVAVQYGQLEIVKYIKKMTSGANPVLPCWLLSTIDSNTKNTILHFASELTTKEANTDPLQMQDEIRSFEYVKSLLPEDLVYSRNISEKTAQELFTEKHKEMVEKAKNDLQEKGKQYSSLVAAVVFASSFSIPGNQDSNNNPDFYNKPAFKMFSHSYVIGLSCAATSLVLFLSLVATDYREKNFRRSIPTKYTFASLAFSASLVALIIAFACNFYLSIYGGRKLDPKNFIPFVCELTALPAICVVVLMKVGCDFGIVRTIRSFWG